MLVIYPFSLPDQDQALKNARWIAELGGCEHHDLFIVSDRRCPAELVKEVAKTFTGKFNLVKHRWTESDIDGWPQGANHMFGFATALIQHTREWPYFLWLEPDAIPICKGWLDTLEAEHKRGGKAFTGEKVDLGTARPDVPIHMSGVAIYQNPIYMLAGEAYRAHDVAWDIAAKDQILPNCHFTKLIQHYWKHGTFTHLNEIRQETVVFHSSKDGSLIDVLRKNMGGGVNTDAPDGAPLPGARGKTTLGDPFAPPTQIRKLRDGTWVLEGDTIISEQVVQNGRLDFDLLIPHILQHIRPGDTVVDVGAFIGDHTVAYSHAVGKDGKVIAYEPSLYAFHCLVHNVERCGNVFTFNHALGTSPDVVRMTTSPNAASNYIGGVEGDNIIVRPLDEDISIFERLDLIKIDTEGYELKVLKGAEKLIEKFHPKLVVEINEIALNRQHTTPEDVIAWIVRKGYQVSILHRHGPDVPFYDILAVANRPPEISSAVGSAHSESPSVAPPVAAPRQPTVKEEIEWHVGVLKQFCESSPQTKAIVMQKLVYAGLKQPNQKKKHATSKTHKQTNGERGAAAEKCPF
jgi:FkbM family methyltransferase